MCNAMFASCLSISCYIGFFFVQRALSLHGQCAKLCPARPGKHAMLQHCWVLDAVSPDPRAQGGIEEAAHALHHMTRTPSAARLLLAGRHSTPMAKIDRQEGNH
jgi:hypothetical protein